MWTRELRQRASSVGLGVYRGGRNPSGAVRRITYVATLARAYFVRRVDVIPMEPGSKDRRPYRAPVGMPKGRENWRVGSAASLLLHLTALALLLMRLTSSADLKEFPQGAGGAGPAGGGGGGNRGTGGVREVVRFVVVAPPMPTPTARPVVAPPPAIPPLAPPSPQPQAVLPPLASPTLPLGVAGGAGTDNTTGSGLGSGGGVGSGVGTGQGTGIGPGTGGGIQPNYPPTPTEMFIPPLPVPQAARGFHVIAEFDVDERGRVLGMTFTPTRDRGYNRRLEDVLRGFRFRPGTRPDGTPVRMKAQVTIDLP